jgi:zinc and cadmium transporter
VHGYDAVVDEKMTTKRFVYLNLLGDGIHNLVDGMIITAAFLVAVPAGVTATLAVMFHELPQEIGDFGILVYGGFTRHRALLANFLTALTAFAGVLIASYFSAQIHNFASYLIAFGGGGFTYIAAAELIPEMQKERNLGRSAVQFAIFILGLVLIWLLVTFMPG